MPMVQAFSQTQVAARLFRGLADPTRLAILLALAQGERKVADLVGEVGSSQANVSGHLACLKDCGLVVDRAQGRANLYRLARPELQALLRAAEDLLAGVGHRVRLCDHDPGPMTPGRRSGR